jgi:hypothetical protein
LRTDAVRAGRPVRARPLLGKSVALVDDARLSARADGQVVSERLLLISGEARSVTVERKHLDSINVQIKTRFVVATNEAPRLTDLSGALASRWSVLQFTRSFYGHEDRSLVGRLLAELPGIFCGRSTGGTALRRQGCFSRPAVGRRRGRNDGRFRVADRRVRQGAVRGPDSPTGSCRRPLRGVEILLRRHGPQGTGNSGRVRPANPGGRCRGSSGRRPGRPRGIVQLSWRAFE